MKKIINRGFTLIELLVVIAIIGILASIVLVSLNSARSKGKDTRVISDVKQIQTQLESDLGTNGIYNDLYFATANTANGTGAKVTAANANLATLEGDMTNNNDGTAVAYRVATNASAGSVTAPNVTAYAVWGKLNGTAGYFCVDSTGNVGTYTTVASTGAATCH